MSEEILRIRKLLEHWIEHNDEHVSRFRETSDEAEMMGIAEAAKHLRTAVEKGEEVSAQLKMALDSMS